MARGQKGAGSVFQRTNRDARGPKKRANNWYIEYVVGGRTIEFVKKRVSDGLNGKIVLSNQVTLEDLRDLIVNDYRNNGRKSFGHLEQVRLPGLAEVVPRQSVICATTELFLPGCGAIPTSSPDWTLTSPDRERSDSTVRLEICAGISLLKGHEWCRESDAREAAKRRVVSNPRRFAPSVFCGFC